MQPKTKKDKIGMTALYCRLSRDDGMDGESNSIVYFQISPRTIK